MVFALVGALIGAALARFTFPALIPVMAGAVIIALANATIGGAAFGATPYRFGRAFGRATDRVWSKN